jgi:hypothetical protein
VVNRDKVREGGGIKNVIRYGPRPEKFIYRGLRQVDFSPASVRISLASS